MSNRQARRAAARRAAKQMAQQGIDPNDETAKLRIIAATAQGYRNELRDLLNEANNTVELLKKIERPAKEISEAEVVADVLEQTLADAQVSFVQKGLEFLEAVDPDRDEPLVQVARAADLAVAK